jgi:hypothetical protein
MCSVPNSTRSIGYGETSWEDGSVANTTPTTKSSPQELIRKANSIPITNIFKHYGLKLNEFNRKICCPLPSHKGGKERSASFTYYPESNTFICFGCNAKSFACDLIHYMDGISREKAARQILAMFGDEVLEDADYDDVPERLEMMLELSTSVRDFRNTYSDQKSEEFIETLCEIYDDHNAKRKLNNRALRLVIDNILKQIKQYKP